MKAIHFFKALSDVTRLRLIHVFMHFELNVNEVVAMMEMGQSRISRHLKILADSGLLTHRRFGLWTFYSAVTDGPGEHFLQNIRFLFEDGSVFQQDLRKAARIVKDRSGETIRFFEAIAEDWKQLKREIIGTFDLDHVLLKYIPNTDTIVDLGCGTGDLLPLLKERARVVIGVDNTPSMLEQARQRFAVDESTIDLRIGDIEHLPLKDGEADVAVINMVLHHLVSPPAAFEEIRRVLKPGGLFIICDFLHHTVDTMKIRYGDRWMGFRVNEIEQWLAESGFPGGVREKFALNRGLTGFIHVSQRETTDQYMQGGKHEIIGS